MVDVQVKLELTLLAGFCILQLVVHCVQHLQMLKQQLKQLKKKQKLEAEAFKLSGDQSFIC